MERVLITGACGNIGYAVRQFLADRYEFVPVDVTNRIHKTTHHRRPLTQGRLDPEVYICDVRDARRVRQFMEGCSLVFHLAIMAPHERHYGRGSKHDDPDRQSEAQAATWNLNVAGTHNVLKIAKQSGVRRVVLASSVQSMWGYPEGTAITSGMPLLAGRTAYALSKAVNELQAEQSWRYHGLSTIAFRIGCAVPHRWTYVRRHKIYSDRVVLTSLEDIASAFDCAAQADVDHGVFALLSRNDDSCWTEPMDETRRVLGWEPKHWFRDDGVATLGGE